MKLKLTLILTTVLMAGMAMAQSTMQKVHSAWLFDFTTNRTQPVVGYEITRVDLGDFLAVPFLKGIDGSLWAPVLGLDKTLNLGSAFVASKTFGHVTPFLGVNFQVQKDEKARGGIIGGLEWRW